MGRSAVKRAATLAPPTRQGGAGRPLPLCAFSCRSSVGFEGRSRRSLSPRTTNEIIARGLLDTMGLTEAVLRGTPFNK
jgi:hypothetical protein